MEIKGIKIKKILTQRGSRPEFFIGEDNNFYFLDSKGDLYRGEIRRTTKRFVVVRFETPTYRMTVNFYKNSVLINESQKKNYTLDHFLGGEKNE